MAKRYPQFHANLATITELNAYIANFKAGAQRLQNFPLGELLIPADALVYVVTANDGTTVTLTLVGAQT